MFNHYDEVRTSVAETGKEHPQIYGDWSIGNLPISNFIGYSKNKTRGTYDKVKYHNNAFKIRAFDKDTIVPNNASYQLAGNENEKNSYSI